MDDYLRSTETADNNLLYKYGSSYCSFDARAKDSAVKKLFEAFNSVLNVDGERHNELVHSVDYMMEISSILMLNNQGLGASWENAANSCKKMEQKIFSIIIDMVKGVNAYIEATYAEEINITKKTEDFNDNINNINNSLDELDNL